MATAGAELVECDAATGRVVIGREGAALRLSGQWTSAVLVAPDRRRLLTLQLRPRAREHFASGGGLAVSGVAASLVGDGARRVQQGVASLVGKLGVPFTTSSGAPPPPPLDLDAQSDALVRALEAALADGTALMRSLTHGYGRKGRELALPSPAWLRRAARAARRAKAEASAAARSALLGGGVAARAAKAKKKKAKAAEAAAAATATATTTVVSPGNPFGPGPARGEISGGGGGGGGGSGGGSDDGGDDDDDDGGGGDEEEEEEEEEDGATEEQEELEVSLHASFEAPLRALCMAERVADAGAYARVLEQHVRAHEVRCARLMRALTPLYESADMDTPAPQERTPMSAYGLLGYAPPPPPARPASVWVRRADAPTARREAVRALCDARWAALGAECDEELRARRMRKGRQVADRLRAAEAHLRALVGGLARTAEARVSPLSTALHARFSAWYREQRLPFEVTTHSLTHSLARSSLFLFTLPLLTYLLAHSSSTRCPLLPPLLVRR